MRGSVDLENQPQRYIDRCVLVWFRFIYAAGLAVCLQAGVDANAAEPGEQRLQNSQTIESGAISSDLPVLPETRRQPSPELPSLQPRRPVIDYNSADAAAATRDRHAA
jgi:hypothetical protein